MSVRVWSACAVALALGTIPLGVRAQETQADGRVVYTPEFFAAMQPANAMDMINKLPGFTFSKGEDVRGFAGAAGNVLIDGKRPASKSVALDQLLQRVPTSQVLRIELIRGGAPGIDMQGQPVMANVVRKPGSAATGAVQMLFKPYQDGYVGLVPRVEETWRNGPWSAEGVVGGRTDYHTDSGEGRLDRTDGSGAPTEQGSFLSDVKFSNFTANGLVGADFGSRALRLTAGVDRTDTDRRETGRPQTLSGQSFVERALTKVRNDKAEIGADLETTVAYGVDTEVVLLHTLKRDTQRSRAFGRTTEQASYELAQTRESIARLVFTLPAPGGIRLQTGGEAAVNALDSRSALSVGGVPVAVPAAIVTIHERRGEVFGTASGKLGAGLRWETGLRFEASSITQEGTGKSRELGFLKPRGVLAWSPDAATQLRVRVERTVGQLKFKDFAATAELEAGTVNAGNPNIQPERSWVLEVAAERRFWNRGAITLSAATSEVEKVVDFLPISGRFDAPGNIGDGRRHEFKAAISAPLDRVGLKDAQIQFQGTWRWSRVRDPVTGEFRRLSGERPFEGNISVTKALPKLHSSIGLDTFLGYSETYYRISEIRTFEEDPMLKVYWDWTRSPDLIFRFQVENFNAKDRRRLRTLYNGPRSLGLVQQQELRNAEQAPFLMIRVRKTF